MGKNNKTRIGRRAATHLVFNYARKRVLEQMRTVSFIVAYLLFFQFLILRLPVGQGGRITGGIVMIIFGLAFFLEGIRLGLIPLGQQVGLRLPERCTRFRGIAVFSFFIGFGATLAEPAIAALRMMGSGLPAWRSPLLYYLLEQNSGALLAAIGIGVGVAVILGLARFYYGLPLKPFIFSIIPVLLLITIVASTNQNLSQIVGLAWDSGAVTTGAVTVPLVIAIGLGVTRAAGRGGGERSGFGTIMLASALPVLTVLILGMIISPRMPAPATESDFFSPANRQQALKLFESEKQLCNYVFTHGGETGRRAFYADEDQYRDALYSLATDLTVRREKLGEMELSSWLEQVASDVEKKYVFQHLRSSAHDIDAGGAARLSKVLSDEFSNAFRAVIPITFFVLFVLLLLLRTSPRYNDEVFLGIILALLGMTFLTAGIRIGLRPIGNSVGAGLPNVFEYDPEEQTRVVIEDFDEQIIFRSITPEGLQKDFFYLHIDDDMQKVQYDTDQHDRENKRYVHVAEVSHVFRAGITLFGLGLVFLFAFGLGYGSTLAEPALQALGETVEDVTVGTVKGYHIVHAVGLGVGIGIMAGVGSFLYGIPTVWVIVPPYLALLFLTFFCEEDFVDIAWDTGGVTTGPVTVPLVLALGLGLGARVGILDSFGILACASAYPILTVLLYGLYLRRRNRRYIAISTSRGADTDE